MLDELPGNVHEKERSLFRSSTPLSTIAHPASAPDRVLRRHKWSQGKYTGSLC